MTCWGEGREGRRGGGDLESVDHMSEASKTFINLKHSESTLSLLRREIMTGLEPTQCSGWIILWEVMWGHWWRERDRDRPDIGYRVPQEKTYKPISLQGTQDNKTQWFSSW
jgi:hypothetical protein